MAKAIEAVEEGMPTATAAKKFGVPRVTLCYKTSGKSPKVCRFGPATVLSDDEEKILVQWLLSTACLQYPVTKEILHPELSERVAQNLTTARANLTEEQVRNWFSEVHKYLRDKSILDITNDPNRVFNADESAFFLQPKGEKVITKKGSKVVYSIGNDEKENLTVLMTANAAGKLAPPMIVFSYAKIPSLIANSIPTTWGIGRSESGWMCGPTFYEYMTNVFYPWLIQEEIQRPIIFFIDGHVSHMTLNLSQFCSENGIELIALFPNSTHLLQPMDVAVFGPLKKKWKVSVKKWRLANSGNKLKKENFGPVLFWPQPTTTKKRKNKEKIPSVVTSEAWQKYHMRKEEEKVRKQLEKEERSKARLEKRELKVKSLKKAKFEPSSSESSEEWIETEDSLDDIELVEESEEEPCDIITCKKPNVGDYVLVKFCGGKRNSTLYRYACVVQEIYPNDNEVEVMSMKCISDDKRIFKMDEENVSVVKMTSVIGKLSSPILLRTGARLKYEFSKPVNIFEKA
ncbi:hypothetical protein ANN_13765 [Periplaneta americana]|uniref:Uncharacterized protein n=1 Tax=Periplaneta americana TaxID=6978 RepID=A0ABQ8SW04_PERAM|nr:hypothetical protein ANN_13765 [Periplaneta americana]